MSTRSCKLADTKREAQTAQDKAIKADAFKLSRRSDAVTNGPPVVLKPVPYFNFAPMQNALVRLKASAKAYDEALKAKGDKLPAATKGKLVALAGKTEQALLVEPGLPGGRGWYQAT